MRRVSLLMVVGLASVLPATVGAQTAIPPGAVVCLDTNRVDGDNAQLCNTHSLKRHPGPNDLIRSCPITGCVWSDPTLFVLRKFGPLMVTDAMDSARPPTDVLVYTPADQNDWSAVTDWASRAKSNFLGVTEIPPGQTATIGVTWTKPVGGEPNTGYWIYSRVVGGEFGKIKQITDPNVLTTTLSGFGPGQYEFTMTAVNAQGESQQLAPIPLELIGGQPLPGAPNPPGNFSITSVTISGS